MNKPLKVEPEADPKVNRVEDQKGETLPKETKSKREKLDDEVEKALSRYDPERREKLRAFTNEYLKGKSTQEAIGLSEAYTEAMYSMAYRLYQNGKYDQAIQIFRLLVMVNPLETRYLMGLSACFHMMGDYDRAADSYTLCNMASPQDPLPLYHASDCFLALEDWVMAAKALNSCIKLCGEKSEYEQIKNRAEVSLKMLEDRLNEAAG